MESMYLKVASRFFLAGDEARHFLDACFLCKRRIANDRHVFMYRGDAAFCSDDCRQDQMHMDAALAAAARRHRVLCKSGLPAVERARRPAVDNADLTARDHVVSG